MPGAPACSSALIETSPRSPSIVSIFVSEHESLLASLFKDSVSTACGDPTRAQSALFPEEEALVSDASPSRRLEFLEGRACAHAALRRLGYDEAPILRGKARQPRWPSGFVGSISH